MIELMRLKPLLLRTKSIFVKNFNIEINASKDSKGDNSELSARRIVRIANTNMTLTVLLDPQRLYFGDTLRSSSPILGGDV